MMLDRAIQLLQIEKEYRLKQTGHSQQPINKEVRQRLDIAIEAVKFHCTGEANFKALQSLAAADVVKVIRCKNCRYYNRRWGCRKLEINVSPDNYCFLAELAVADREVVLPDEE